MDFLKEQKQIIAERLNTLNIILGGTGLSAEMKKLNHLLGNFIKSNEKTSSRMVWLTLALVFVGLMQAIAIILQLFS